MVLNPIVKGANKNAMSWLYFIGVLLFVVLIAVVMIKVYKGLQTGATALGNEVADQTTALQTGVDATRIKYIRSTAESLWSKSTTNIGVAYIYTHNDFVNAINSMTSTKEVALLSEYFKEQGGKTLKSAFDSFIPSEKDRLHDGYYDSL